MLELLSQLDGFSPDDRIKVIAATNRPDTLDPALMRSGRLDRKIEFPLPNEEAKVQILQIHSRKMNVSQKGKQSYLYIIFNINVINFKDVNFLEIARSMDDFNCA